VAGDKKGTLKFEAVTQTARAPARLRPTQRDLVDGFVQRAIQTTANDPALEQTLFEMLVPNDFKPYAPDRRRLALMLKGTAAAIPWELIRDGFDRNPEPVAVACGMIRQLLVPAGRALVLRSPEPSALVVGNPIVSDPRFPPLAGAKQEALAVEEVLKASEYQVQRLVDGEADPQAVLSALHSRPWRILHLAAHGVYDFDPGGGKPRVSGLVLDTGLFFTPAEADQLRYVPDLVFINCCHLGQMRGDTSPQAFHKLAANVATQFITMGARAVIAAGWAVDDAAAKTFATSLYRHMLDGQLYGDAVLLARRETFYRHAHTNTWGAYQCYGDPSFSLAKVSTKPRTLTFVSQAELAVRLEQLTANARNSRGNDLLELEDCVAKTPAAWWTSADMCATAAAALAEYGQFERAAAYYDKASKAELALGPLRAVEQQAGCRVRWAGALLVTAPPDKARARALLAEAEATLRQLLEIGKTSERWSLLGSVMKGRARAGASVPARRAALREMSRLYQVAYRHSVENGKPDAYSLSNRIAADIVLDWQRARPGRHVTAALEELEQLADKVSGTHTDAYNLSAPVDQLLLQALHKRMLTEATRDRISQLMADAMSRGASSKAKDSMRRQLLFFREMMATQFPARRRRQMIDQLKKLETQLFPS
jgi:hypothetical protein